MRALPEPAPPALPAAKDRAVGIACGIAVILFFSGFTLVSRRGFASALTLPDIAALRFSVGGLLLLPILLRHGFGGLRWRQAALLAFFGGVGFALFAYAGFSLAPASHGAVLLHGTLPLFTFALVQMGTRPRAQPGQVAGLGLIALGIVAMAWDSASTASWRQVLGDGSLLLASACWSAYGVLAQRLHVRPAHAASIVAVLSMCCFLPVYLFLPGKALLLVGWRELLLQAVFQGVLIGALSIFVYTRAVAALGAAQTALFTAAVPCVTTFGALLLLAEVPTAAALGGVALVTAGMGVAMRYAAPQLR